MYTVHYALLPAVFTDEDILSWVQEERSLVPPQYSKNNNILPVDSCELFVCRSVRAYD